MKDIQDLIHVLAKDKHKKLNFKNIMNILAELCSSEYLEKYNPFIHEYVKQNNNESEVKHVIYIYYYIIIHLSTDYTILSCIYLRINNDMHVEENLVTQNTSELNPQDPVAFIYS